MLITFKNDYQKVRHHLKNFIICLLVCSLTGCAGESSKEQKGQEAVITVWHWMSDRDDAFQALAKKFETEQHVKVKFELYAPSEAYAQRVKASAQTNKLPDIYGVLGEKRDFASFIKSGYVANLNADLLTEKDGSAWKGAFSRRRFR